MCLAVYIASDVELPVIPWNDASPAFYLEPLPAREAVRAQFTLPNVYYAGSHLGCGCGFFKDGEEGEDLEIHHRNYVALAQCMAEASSRGAHIELFSCWEGDQTEAPEQIDTITPSLLSAPAFELKEKQLLHVRQDV